MFLDFSLFFNSSNPVFCFFFLNDGLNSSAIYISLNLYVYLSFSIQVFLFGLLGTAFNKHNFITLLLSIEIMLLGLSLIFIGFTLIRSSTVNMSLPLLILAVSACESAIGLSLILFMYKQGWKTDNFLLFNKQPFNRKLKLNSDNIIFLKLPSFQEKKTFFINDKKLSSFFFILFSHNLIFKNQDYLNSFFFWLVSALFLIFLLILARIFAFYNPGKQKLSPYECGFEPFSDARGKQDILFYVVAILFILFDVELVFLIPWALSYFCLPVVSYYFILFFILTLVIGFAYEWRNGALNWVIKQ